MAGRRAPGGGRKRKPTMAKILEGTFRKDRANPNEPMPDAVFPDPPSFLNKDAKAEWKRLRAKYGPMGVISELDRGVLTIYCQAWSQVKEAETDIQKRGTFVPVLAKRITGEGVEVDVVVGHQKNPYCALRKEGLETLRKAAVELGITPSAKSRVSGTPSGFGTQTPKAPGAPAPPAGNKFWKASG
jgi:P27 family predicted phage terminase small subunit